MDSPRLAVFATHGKFLEKAPQVRLTFTSLSIGPEGSSMEGLSLEELLSADPQFRSMLTFAGANQLQTQNSGGYFDDGLLTAYEVWGLQLHDTELVALIACESGLGVVQDQSGSGGGLRQPSGEVVSGLRQAFSMAGARAIVMSMWQVPVIETMRFLEGFFDAWLNGHQDRYTAFHNSQLEALRYARDKRNSGHPFWWAGFVYFGDPGDIRQ
jgi:CHAT domain-containing protein